MTQYIIKKFTIDNDLIYSETFTKIDNAKMFYQGALLDSLFSDNGYFELWYFDKNVMRLMNITKKYNFNEGEYNE